MTTSLPPDRQRIIAKTADHVRGKLAGDSSGHDWWHIARVWGNARQIAAAEAADLFVVELAALLHDIADWKFHGGDETAGPRAAREWLDSLHVEPQIVDHVCRIIAEVTFKGADVATPMSSVEGRVVQDADRLDAIGAVGIGRAFAYGGHKGRLMYDPAVPPERHDSFDAYRRNTGPTINHFYEKLLLLKDRMQTETGRALALQRHQFMETFLAQFFAEWDCGAGPDAERC